MSLVIYGSILISKTTSSKKKTIQEQLPLAKTPQELQTNILDKIQIPNTP